jgi:hypothetical protein
MSAIGNPLVPLGTLNRLRASVIWPAFPQLNVSAAFLAKEGIQFDPEGEITNFIEVLAGAVPSPEPYLLVRFRLPLIKSQSFADQYKLQYETLSLLGPAVIRPDTSTGLSPFPLVNCAITAIEGMSFSGDQAQFPIGCRGTYYINNTLWSGL